MIERSIFFSDHAMVAPKKDAFTLGTDGLPLIRFKEVITPVPGIPVEAIFDDILRCLKNV